MPGEKIFAFEEVLDAADMTQYFVQQSVVIKSADESVTSSTTLQDDNDLQMTVSANTKYWVEVFLIYNAMASADCKISYLGPVGATMEWVSDGHGSAAAATIDVVSRSYQTLGTTPSHGGVESPAGTPVNMAAVHKGLLTVGATAGLFKLQWAQLASIATATKVIANSTMILTRVT